MLVCSFGGLHDLINNYYCYITEISVLLYYRQISYVHGVVILFTVLLLPLVLFVVSLLLDLGFQAINIELYALYFRTLCVNKGFQGILLLLFKLLTCIRLRRKAHRKRKMVRHDIVIA